MADDDARWVWQSQSVPGEEISMDRLRARAEGLKSAVERRNRSEFIAVRIVFVIFTAYFFLFPSPWMKAGSLLILLGAIVMALHLKKHGAPEAIPAGGGRLTCIQAQRRELQRQCDLLRRVWLWYVAPFVPGTAVFLIGAFDRFGLKQAVFVTAIASVFIAIAVVNYLASRHLRRRIDELDAMMG